MGRPTKTTNSHPLSLSSDARTLSLSSMDFSGSSSSSSRSRANKKADIYSTFVVHDDGSDNDEDADEEEEEEEDSSSLPPLLQRLPKDFGAAIDDDDDEDDDDGGGDYSGTFIVKKDNRPSPAPASRRTLRSRSPRGRSDLDDVYSTFVVKSTLRSRAAAAEEEEEDSSVSGTFVRRSVGGFGSPFMSEAVESMRASEQQQRQEHVRRKASVSSVPESLTREDPSTKYELLHELGECLVANLEF